MNLFDRAYRRRGPYHWRWYFGRRKWPPYIERMDQTVEFFSQKGGRLLEIGCGDGLLLHLLSENEQLSCFGIDISSVAIRLAHEQGVHNCTVGIAEEWGPGCDYVVMSDTLEHIVDYESALDAVARIMGPGGIFLLVAPKQERLLPLDFHFFSKADLFNILESRFDVIEHEESKTAMRFVCKNTIFDPREMNIKLGSKRAVRVWRARLKAHLIRTRPFRCDCCGDWLSGGPDMHEGIVTKGDVRGWRLPRKAWINSEYNCVLLLHAHHIGNGPPLREFVWDLQCERYGDDAMLRWYESLPWKSGKPPRLFLRGGE